MKQTMALLLVLAMMWGQVARAEEDETASSAPRMSFTDVPAAHWAIKHVTKLALLGIITGYEDGSFRPDNQVSQQEVIAMVIRMMGLEDEALRDNTDYVLPPSMQTGDFFKPYVAKALDSNLLKIEEESGSESSAGWGTRSASREWVAKVVIRALGQESEAAKLADTATSFSDNRDISASALGYVNAAVQLQIVTGFEDGSFKPQGAVTRAQMATFLSRADQYLENRSSRVAIGYVKQLEDRKLELSGAGGQAAEFALSNQVVLYDSKGDRIPSSFIQPGAKVYVIHDNGTAYYVEDLNERQTSETVSGVLSQVNLERLHLTIVNETGTQTYNISRTVSIVDRDGKGWSLGALINGSRLELVKTGDTVEQIIIKSVPANKSGEAMLVSVDLNGAKITWLDTATNQTESWAYTGETSFLYNGNVISPEQLNPGDNVQYTVENDVLTSLIVTKAVVEPQGTADEGILESFDLAKKIITITTPDNELRAYRLADNAQVVIEGLPSASLGDLMPGDNLKIELLNNAAKKITIVNRSVKANLMSTIINYDPDLKVLTVEGASGGLNAYKLTSSTNIVYDGNSVTLDNFSTFFLKGKKVDITASGDTLVSIRMAMRYDGTITSINTKTNDLTLKLEDGNIFTFKLATYTGVSIPGVTNATLAALKPGDEVRVMLNPTQDQVNNVTVRRSVIYRVESKSENSNQITVKEPFGPTVTYSLGSGTPVYSQAQTSLTLNDIVPGALLNVSLFGSSIDKITVLNPVRGKITAIDTAGKKLTIQNYNQASVTVALNENPNIVQNGQVLSGIGALKAGDRVEVVTDPNGKVHVHVATAMKRVVSSYSAYDGKLVLKRENIGDETDFKFMPNAYVHDRGQVILPNYLYEPNEVMVYVLDGKIMELERLK